MWFFLYLLDERQRHKICTQKDFNNHNWKVNLIFVSDGQLTSKRRLKGSDPVTSTHLVVVPRSSEQLNRIRAGTESGILHHHGWPGLREVCFKVSNWNAFFKNMMLISGFLRMMRTHQYRTVPVENLDQKIYTYKHSFGGFL